MTFNFGMNFFSSFVRLGVLGVASGILVVQSTAATILSDRSAYIRNGMSATSGADFANSPQSASSNTVLHLASKGVSNDRKDYLGFNISGKLSAGYAFSNVSLSLTTYTTAFSGAANGTVTISVYGVTGSDLTTTSVDWSAANLTWNNAPQNEVGSSTGVLSGTTLLGTIAIDTTTITGNQTVTLTGAALDTYLNWASGLLGNYYGTGVTGDTTPTLILVASYGLSNPDIQLYSSTSTSYSPRLTYDVAAVPEGSSLALVLSGVVVVATLRFRKRIA